MSTALSIDSRLDEMSDFGEGLVDLIVDIVNDNFKKDNVSKGVRGNSSRIITFVEGEFENVFLEIEYNSGKLEANIKVVGNESPLSIKINLDRNVVEQMPNELIQYLEG